MLPSMEKVSRTADSYLRYQYVTGVFVSVNNTYVGSIRKRIHDVPLDGLIVSPKYDEDEFKSEIEIDKRENKICFTVSVYFSW